MHSVTAMGRSTAVDQVYILFFSAFSVAWYSSMNLE